MLSVNKSQLSTNVFDFPKTYKSHTVLDHADMHAFVDVKGALEIIKGEYGNDIDIVGDDSSYFEFKLSVKSLFDDNFRNEKFWLDFTPLNYGGYRYWLLCLHCKARRTKLYITTDRVACMNCLGLIYATKSGGKKSKLVLMYKFSKVVNIINENKKMTYRGKPTRHARRLKRYYQDVPTLAEHYS